MRQSDSVSEELDTENVQCALDFENTMNELETQLYYRHLPPKEVALRVMEAACKFYDADWCGLIQVDLDLGLWKPLWWHNECQEDKTTILTNEFESSEFLDRWVKAVRRGTPMVVSDAEDVKDTYPDEYRLYERLGIKSVLAIPLEPRQIALIAVRNPQRYTHQTSMLKLLAYVLLAAYNDKRMADSLSMAFSPENIKSSHDVFISLFGELKIHTSHGVLPESDLKSPKISRLLTFMLLSNKKALSSLEIVQEIWPEELEDKDEPGKKVKQLVYRLRQACPLLHIKTTAFIHNRSYNLMIDKFSQVAENLPAADRDADRQYHVINGYPVVFSFSKEPNPEAFERIRNILLATSYTKKVG